MPGGGLGRRPFPDLAAYSHREYGNRVGLYRVLEVLDKYGIKATAAIDATIAEHYPDVVAECKSRGYEFIGHGKALTHMITSNMTEDEERAYVKSALDTVERMPPAPVPADGGAPSRARPPGRPPSWPKKGSTTSAIGPTTSSPIR